MVYDTRIQPRKLFLINIYNREQQQDRIIHQWTPALDKEIILPEEVLPGSIEHIAFTGRTIWKYNSLS